MEKEHCGILAVDDESFTLLLLKSCLDADRYRITACTNAQDALKTFKKEEYDVVILDIMMDGIDGFETRDIIRGINPDIPIIFLTSMLDDLNSTLLGRITKDKASYYLNKSFSKRLLVEKIEYAVSEYRTKKTEHRYLKQLEEDLSLAGEVQQIMLPAWCMLKGGTVMSYVYTPKMKVSGDLVEFCELGGGRFFCLVGDIAGHSIQAALYMTTVQSFIRLLAASPEGKFLKPHEYLNRINDFFCNDLNYGNYMTCLAAVFDFPRKKLIVHNAGQPPILRCSLSKPEFEVLMPEKNRSGIPVGWRKDYRYLPENDRTIDFTPDDLFLLCTDGLFDMGLNGNPDEKPDRNMLNTLASKVAAGTNPVLIPYMLCSSISRIGYGDVSDDVSVLAVGTYKRKRNVITRLIEPTTASVEELTQEFSSRVFEVSKDRGTATRIELLLGEFLNNIVIHGSPERRRNKLVILVEMTVSAEKTVIKVYDKSLNTCCLENPVSKEEAREAFSNLNSCRATSGRGKTIIRSIASAISREFFSGLNVTVFTVRPSKEKSEESKP